jgi:cell division protein ZapB
MDIELAALEERIRKVAALCQSLRKENLSLRQNVAASQQQIKQLNAKLEHARARLASLIERLPEDV